MFVANQWEKNNHKVWIKIWICDVGFYNWLPQENHRYFNSLLIEHVFIRIQIFFMNFVRARFSKEENNPQKLG